jgi:hypothetical protein
MKKITLTLNESKLRQLIQNSIKRVIKENEEKKYNWEYMDDDDFFFDDDDDFEMEFDPNAIVDTEDFEDTGEIYKIPEAKIVIEKVPEFEDLGPQKYIFFMGHTMSLMNFEECLYDVCRFEVDQYPVKERVFQRWLNSLNHEQLIEAFKKAMEG